MESILYGYEVNFLTWLYLSGMLIVAVYMRFSRFWSSRNLDLLLLLATSPGLALVSNDTTRTFGFVWLLVACGLIVIRALVDPWLRWRPRFEQNMNPPGMLFLGSCAMLFLAVRAFTADMPHETQRTFERAGAVVDRDATDPAADPETGDSGPAMTGIAAVNSFLFAANADRALAMLSHLAVVIGLLIVGRRVFESPGTGVAMATLYLFIPSTAFDVGAVDRVLPAALTLWAFVVHRHPRAAGAMLGVACGTQLFPMFLLPVWGTYYGKAGIKRFLTGLIVAAVISVASLAFTSTDPDAFVRQSLGSFNPYLIALNGGHVEGFWGADGWAPYRIPVLAAYLLLALLFAVLPRKKSLEMLLAQSLILIVATQFWYPDNGGVYIQWYLPLLLLMMFRPRLPATFLDENEALNASRRSESTHNDRVGLPKNASLN